MRALFAATVSLPLMTSLALAQATPVQPATPEATQPAAPVQPAAPGTTVQPAPLPVPDGQQQAPATAQPEAPATAQQPPVAATEPAAPTPDNAEEMLRTDPAVQQSQQPEPTPQGTRSPEPLPSPTQSVPLDQALQQVWNTPTDLDGNPIAPAAVPTEPGPAAHTAAGCETADQQLAQTPAGVTPCPDAGADPTPGDGSAAQ